jgi:site-specific DNA-methyltransferase (adenine-specific)
MAKIIENQIINRDCIEGMKELADESVQLIIADPPYNLSKDFGEWKEADQRERWLPWSKEWIDQCKRILSPGGSLFVYGIHHHMCWIQCYLYEIGLDYRRQIIWNYENGFANYKNSLAAHYEPLLWFSKGPSYTYHPIREPYKSTERLKNKITKNGKVWTPHPEGRKAGDVWKFPVLAGKRFENERVAHPTQKPLSISLRIVEHFSNPGDLVGVPFVGSGTECLAAVMCQRKFIGFELNTEYINIANQRIDDWENSLFGVDSKPKITNA